MADIGCGNGGHGCVTVNNQHMQLWGVTEQELFGQAKANMDAADDTEVKSMAEIIREFAGDEAAEEIGVSGCSAVPMYVATNRGRLYGASVMVDHKAMSGAARMFGGDFMILPSSVHELILVPYSEEPDGAERLMQMVQDVNDTEVAEEEVLSCHVYRYDFRSGEISIAA